MRCKIYKMIYVAVAYMSLAAYGNWLDVDPSDQYFTGTFWKTKEHAGTGIVGYYNALKPWCSLHVMEFDMLTANVMPYNEANDTQVVRKSEHLSTTALIESLWKDCYVGIGHASTFIANVGGIDMDESKKAKVVGEARFLRVFYYLSLVDEFGDVSLTIDVPNADEQTELLHNSKEEVVNQIVKDLEEAATVLPDTYASSDLGRAAKGAVLVLKVRTLLYNSRWAEATQAAKQVIESGIYQLFNDYHHFFSENNKYNCEVIFNIEAELPEYPTGYDQNIWRLNRPASSKELVDTCLCIDEKTIEESSLRDPARPYENRGPRLLKLIVCIGYPYLGKTITKEDMATTGFGVKKYTSYGDDVTIPLVERSTFNFILIRYAEVLLTYAEMQNEASGPDQSVYDTVNQLRRRSDINMPGVPEGLTEDQMHEVARHERRVELTSEGLYYSDILRQKTAEKENDDMMHSYEGIEVAKRSFNPKRDYLWPIPYSQTVSSPNLEQSPNWD